MYESIGYPLRSFEYLGYLIYYYQAMPYSFNFEEAIDGKVLKDLRNEQKERIIALISANDGCARPVVDYHSIPIVMLFLFFIEEEISNPHLEFIANYLADVFENILLLKAAYNRYPMLGTNLKILVEYSAEGERPSEYLDNTSILIPTLFELISILDWEQGYDGFKDKFPKELSLQIPHPLVMELDFEQQLFEGHQNDAYYIEAFTHTLPATLQEFKAKISKTVEEIKFRTDEVGFPFLRLLAHFHYKNELPPFEWRKFLSVNENEGKVKP
jgi:hypothetical protein